MQETVEPRFHRDPPIGLIGRLIAGDRKGIAGLLPPPAPQRIERCIVGNAEQPRLGLGHLRACAERLRRLGEGILHDILAIKGRGPSCARHSGATAAACRPASRSTDPSQPPPLFSCPKDAAGGAKDSVQILSSVAGSFAGSAPSILATLCRVDEGTYIMQRVTMVLRDQTRSLDENERLARAGSMKSRPTRPQLAYALFRDGTRSSICS